MENKETIFLDSIDKLSVLIEESTRAKKENIKFFIEPESGMLDRAKSRRHHIIFGRRGSGKTSLLLKAVEDLSNIKVPAIYVDLEPFKGHQYPDVLLSILIRVFEKVEMRIVDYSRNAPKISFQNFKIRFTKKKYINLAKEVTNEIKELQKQLYLIDNSSLVEKQKSLDEQASSFKNAAKAKGPTLPIEIEAELSASNKSISEIEIQEEYKRSKIDFLLKRILNFRKIFEELSKLISRDSFIFFDDLYHIRRQDQAQLLDYFHRIAKGQNLWLKIGTIRHRSQWYIHGQQPIGLKRGDDADEINLDLTLEKYNLAKKHLISILSNLAIEAQAPELESFISLGAYDRLVLASGGVGRDFLGIFRRSISFTRERLQQDSKHNRGPKIGVEDVNQAASEYGETKSEEFEIDTLEDKISLEEAYKSVKSFCLDEANANCFLFDIERDKTTKALLEQLMDLRLIHLVRSRVTVSGRKGKVFQAFLLDLSQYTGARKRRDLRMVKFWQTGAREELRKISYIYSDA